MNEPFTCPVCKWVSHHPEDKRQGYCAYCRDWTKPREDDDG